MRKATVTSSPFGLMQIRVRWAIALTMCVVTPNAQAQGHAACGASPAAPGWAFYFLRMSALFKSLIGGVGMVAPTALSV
jgi:hypothetical protein